MTGCFKTSCFFCKKMHKPRNENLCNFTYWQIHMTYDIMAARSQSKRAELSIISHPWKFVKPFYDKKMHKNFPKISSLCTTDYRGFTPNNYTISCPGLSRLTFKKIAQILRFPKAPFCAEWRTIILWNLHKTRPAFLVILPYCILPLNVIL